MGRHTEAFAIFSTASKRSRKTRRSIRSATALSAGGLLAALLVATPALAQQGGAGGTGGFGNGGAGGEAGQQGSAATCNFAPSSGCLTPGGAAGTEPGGSGGTNAVVSAGVGGGGGGGGNGSVAAPIGGNGGNGGNAQAGNFSTGGGGGGGGGNGVILAEALTNGALVAGGNGGNGGNAGPTFFSGGPGNGGGGGDGGTAIIGSAGAVIVNLSAGSITGGNGGVGGAGSSGGGAAGANGAGGTGILGSDISIENAGSISGGLGGDGVTRAYALHFTGGSNRLALLAGWSITGDIRLDTGSLLNFEVAGTETLGNAISGGGSIAKTGAGTLTLTGSNSYTGSTAINDGTLEIGDPANIGTGIIALNAGTLRTAFDGSLANHLYWNDGATGTVAAATGTTLTLTGTLNFSADTEVRFGSATDTGTIIASFFTGSIGGSSSRAIFGGGLFQAGSGLMSLALGGFGSVQIDAGATLDINGVQPSTTLNILEGAGTLLNDGATTIIASGDFAGTISGTQNVVKSGGATLILSGDNDYSGTTLVDGGVLQIGAGATSGTLGSGDVTLSTGASLVFARADTVTVANAIDGDGSVEQAGPGVLTLTGANSYTGGTIITGGLINFAGTGNFGVGNITLNGGGLQWDSGNTTDISARLDAIGTNGGVFDTNGNDVTLASALSGSGLTKIGSGILTLSGSNSFSGIVTIADGTLLQGSANALGGTDIVLDGGTLDIGSYNLALRQALGITGTGTIEASGGGFLETTGGEASVFGSNGGTITSALGISVTSGSTLTMFGNNVLSGGIVVNGKLVIGESGAAGDASNTINTIGSVVSFANGVDNGAAILIASNTTQFEVLSGDVATQSGAVDGDQAGRGFEKIGDGTLNLTGVNSYDGTALVTGGTLAFNQQGLGASATIAIDNGAAIRLLEDVGHGGDVTILSGGGTIDTDAYTFTVSGGVDFQGELTKLGSGVLMLRDENDAGTGTGGIDVTAGTLALGSDTAAGTGTIKLADSTTLLNASCGCSPLTVSNAIQIALGGTATIDADGYETVLAGNITGGNLVFADTFGGGTTKLTGTNSYGDTTIQSAATLMIGDGGTTGTLGSGIVTTDGMLAFNRSDDVTVSTAIGGSGLLGQFGTGTLILTGTNSYTGGTVIYDPNNPGGPGGTLQVGDGGTSGTLGSGPIFLFGTLVFNRSDDIAVSDGIAGLGQITKLGAGTLTLSGDNLNGLAGPWTGTISVQDGTLAVTEFGLGGAELVELGSGTTLKALEDSYGGDVAVLAGGATIDTGSFTFEMIGALDLQGELTKIGTGTLLLDDLNEEGQGAGGINVTAGTLGLGSDFAGGTGLIKLANGTTLLNAACGCTRLDIDNEIRIALGGTVTFDGAGNRTDLNGAISGGDIHFTTSVAAPFAGGLFRLNGANSYGATRIGPNVALIVYDGTLGTGNVTFDATASDPTTPAALVFQNATDYRFDGKIIGAGIVSVESDPGISVMLTASNTATENFTGTVDVISGKLVLNGAFGDVVNNSASLTLNGGALGGSGTFHGSVAVGNAALNPGNSPGTLVIAGNLALGSGTILNFELGEPGTPGGASNDLVTVGGNLTLDGTLNTIASGAGYGPGYYRLFNYGGTLTDNEILIGSIAGGLDAEIRTNIAGQVNLRLGGSQAIQYWDGTDTGATAGVAGGAGTWNGSSTNWTSPTGYAINDSWQGQVGVFAGTAGGTVTVDGTQAFEELRFETDGYVLAPVDGSARLNTTGGFSIIDVASGIAANIGVVIQGGAGLDKTGTGTLILSAVNTYGGATDVAAGTLRLGINNAIASQSALNVQSGATFDLAGFQTQVGSIAGTGAITTGGGRLDTGYNNASTIFSGTVTGADGGESVFTKNGNGTLTLGGTIELGNGNGELKSFGQVNAGTLQITSTGSFGADLIQNFSTIDNSGTINGHVVFQTFGTVTNAATGTINGTTQNFGIFDNYGTMAALQSLGGSATNHSTGVINGAVQTFTAFTSTGIINGSLSNFATALIENQVNGEIGNFQTGATVTLTDTLTGVTNYQGVQDTLFDLAGFNTTIGAINGNGTVQLGGATLTIDSNRPFASFDGKITGTGSLIKAGTGEQVLGGQNDYTGLTFVNAGTLTLNSSGGLISDVTVAGGATFNSDGTIAGYVDNSGTLNLSGGSVINPALALALINRSGGTVGAAGQINGEVQNAGTFSVSGTLDGVTRFDQAASGQLTLNADFGVGALTGSGTVDTGFYTLTVGDGGANSTFDGVISGGGGLTKTGTGVFVLTADQSYTGQTTVSDGTLTLGLFGAITGQVVNNASFESIGTLRGGLYNDTGATAVLRGQADGLIENHGSVTLSGALFDNGTFEQASGGTFNLAGFNATFGALDGDGLISLGAGRLVVGDNGSDTSFAGAISGSGGLTKAGTGTMTLTGVSTYGGPTQITGGTLQLADGGEIGGAIVYNDATLAFDGAIDRSFGKVIQGSGIVTKTGTNLTTLTGINGYSGGTLVLDGSLGFDNSRSMGTGAVTLANGTRLRNVENAAIVTLSNDIQIDANGMATLQGVDGSSTTFNGTISGGTARFGLSGGGLSTFTLGVANSYGDTRIGGGVSLILAGSGTLGTGNTVFEASPIPSTLTFANGTNYSYGGTISGSGNIVVDSAAATVTLSGSNSAAENFTGTVTVDSGKLVLGGDFGDVVNNSASLTLNGGALGGSGVFHGDITFGNAALNPGNSPGTLVIAGNLTLGAGTILNFELGEAGTVGGANNDLVNVGGNLTLDGTLNVTPWVGFGEGYYRLFNYGGTLTDNGLNLGALPAGYTPTLLTNIAGQVNILFASSPQAIQYWDGGDLTGGTTGIGGDGGSGVWNSTGTNWTAPTGYGVNDSWRSQVAVFGGSSGGTVTVQGIQTFQELRFTTSGYTITGATAADGLATTGGFSVVDVSNGVDATINASISGAGGLTKTGFRTLSLGGTNSYTGDTTVSTGTLVLLAGGALAGAVVNDATFDNRGTVAGLVTNNGTMSSTGTLGGGLSNNGLASIRGALNGAVTNMTSGVITLTGTTTGIGAVTQSGAGRFELAGFDTSFGSLSGTGTVALGGATLTLGGDNSSTSFSGAITGSGGVTKTGTGIFTLTGVNDFTGTTTVSAGTLQLSASGQIDGAVRNDATFNNAGWVSGLVTNTGSLASIGTLDGGLNNSGTASLSGTVNGSVTNSGTIALIGGTSGIGTVTQTAGSSFALNGFDTSFGGLAGAGTVDTGGAVLTLGANNGAGSFAGAITGSGGLTKIGSGTQTLAGTNTYTGLTMVSGGTLAVSTTGSIAGAVRNQATFTNAGTVTGVVQNDAVMTSTGNLAGGLINNGTVSLAGQVGTGLSNNGTVNFAGNTTVASLQQGATGIFNLNGFGVTLGEISGSGAINLGTGTLNVGSNSFSSTYGGTISGSGSLSKTGSRTLVLTNAATHTGGTTVSNGTLQIGNGGTTGSLSGAITLTGTGVLAINRSDAVTLANAMSGTGGFVQAGTGTTTLTGTNSYTGGTIISAGRLRGDTASLQGEIEVNTALEFAQTSNGTYAGSLFGNGLLDKTGVGTLNLTGSSSFRGATHVIAGGLALNGLLSRSIITVSNGATLSGTGTAGGVILQSGATIAPGNSIGTFNVAGNIQFMTGSLYAAEVQASGSDRIQATGNAQLAGTLQVINLGGNYAINSTFVLLHADAGITGTFTVANLASFGLAFRPKLIYTANEVQLFLAPNQLSAVLGTGVPLTYNQASTIGRLDAAVMSGNYDPSALSALYSLAPAAIPPALDALSGEVYADATRAALEDERVVREAALGRLADAADLGLTGNGAWGQLIGSWGSASSDGNAAGYDVDRTGFAMGIDAGDATEEGSWRAGVMGHYTRITVPASARGSRATIDRTGGGIYAGMSTGSLRVRVGAALSLLDLKARRDITVPGLTTSERGKTQGVMLQTFGELGYRIEMGNQSFVEPYLAGSVSRVRFDRFAESSGPVALMVRTQKNVLGVAELGARGEIGLGSIRLGGNIGVRTAFGDRFANPVIALAAAPDQAFNVRSPEIDRFAAVANLNLIVDVSEKLSLRLGYSGIQGSGVREHGGRATLSLKF